MQHNIEHKSLPILDGADDGHADVEKVFMWIDAEAQGAYNWYISEKSQKAAISKFIRLASIFLVTLGALTPIVALVTNGKIPSEAGYLFLASSGGLLLADRSFGYSSSWARYMNAAAKISKTMKKYQLEWLSWKLSSTSVADKRSQYPEIFKEVIIPYAGELFSLLEAETNEWLVDFKSSLDALYTHAEALPRNQ